MLPLAVSIGRQRGGMTGTKGPFESKRACSCLQSATDVTDRSMVPSIRALNLTNGGETKILSPTGC